ncbi:hypothetical protein AMTRI_Chr02g213520 [Amborella trichopoda]|uniref:peptide-N(4)-(N-acetyl-beta- glucosaminyl)asparagine amidase n=1 Tax=Amborella trichopoda TaxID=13333 RepID=UPI0005D300F1|nr:peptide-N(4)-(N-acetyl-beta-glucosaminyl)asparagine amidase [Amborella trichopoda]|eukprot:XP_011626643.1 peptide-N(4)-(N-acetyl-beta-glucosaminyl)asparagine amidase [Amborella trichopoda]
MATQKFLVRHKDSTYEVDYNAETGLEVLRCQLYSLTLVPPKSQNIYRKDNFPVKDDSDLLADSGSSVEELRVVSMEEDVASASTMETSDKELARLLQEYYASPGKKEFEKRIQSHIRGVLMYEDAVLQEEARKTVPVDELEEKALISLAKEGNFIPSKAEQDHAFLLQLLFWFKKSFRWVNSPPCDACGRETSFINRGTASASELEYGASNVELFGCNSCSRITRFPRYNDPRKLLETRRGRCGEWANCFTLYCRAFGFKSRLILDFSDHVWTECFSDCIGRWMHLDPCEGVYDNPLLYEKGWKKKLSYIIGIAKDGVCDVTKRYTRKWPEVLSRRVLTSEDDVSAVLADITRECRRGLSSQECAILGDCDKKAAEELGKGHDSNDDDSIALPGRQSGDKEWRLARSEIGPEENSSLSCFSCPIRTCIDDHVKSIYNALFLLLCSFAHERVSREKTLENIQMLKSLLVDLRNSPFRRRRALVNPWFLFFTESKMLSSVDGFLSALSLKKDLEGDGSLSVCLSGNPIKVSMALPVALDALDELMYNLENVKRFGMEPLSLPVVKFNRLCSGSVQASGEELPVGIVTSAFDGLRLSKWEEPNGARGAWIVYKLLDGEMQELVAYELMSADDAPERDPKDWIVEGSDDGGCTWVVLDTQHSQFFDSRFMRKTYRVELERRMSNAFRFRFLSVRDDKATSRLQIGGIDLYAKGLV